MDLQAQMLRQPVVRLIGKRSTVWQAWMPQQVIGPTARLAERIGIGAPEEIGLHIHLQHFQFPGKDALVNPLMTGIEAARVTGHGDYARLALHAHQTL